MSTFKAVSDVEWCLKAASQDEHRPVLTGLLVTEDELIATNGHILHLVSRYNKSDAMVPGLWGKQRGQRIDGTFPNWQQVVPRVEHYLALNAAEAMPVVEACLAYGKARRATESTWMTLPCTKHEEGTNRNYVAFNAGYLKSILVGRMTPTQLVQYQAPGPSTPMTWFVFGLSRVAVLMPVRRSPQLDTTPDPRFDLSEFVSEVA